MNSTDAALFDNIPAELKALDQWVCWRVEDRDGDPTKVPYNARTGGGAMSTQPDTWSSFDECREAMVFHDYAGVGFVFSPDDPYCGVDLDDCIDDEGNIYPAAQRIIDQLGSYSEISPSGRGVKVFVKAAKTADMPRSSVSAGDDFKKIEIYDRFRYFTVTGNRLPGAYTTVNDPGDGLKAVYDRYFPPPVAVEKAVAATIDGFTGDDADLIRKAAGASNGSAFQALWNGDTAAYEHDDSRADLALCSHLAFYTGPDRSRIDLLFRSSGLMREKWDSRRGEETYGQRTIAKALEGKTEFYDPKRRDKKPAPSAPSNSVVTTDDGRFLIQNPNDWQAVATDFAAQHTQDGVCRFMRWEEQWWMHRDGNWGVAHEDEVKGAIRVWLQRCDQPKPTKNDPDAVVPVPVNRRTTGEVLDCLAAIAAFKGEAPCWLNGDGPDPKLIVTFRNGWIDVADYAGRKTNGLQPVLHPPSIRLFTLGAAPYDFDPHADCPAFKAFIAQVVTPDDAEETNEADVEQIRQWFGYSMMPWNGLEKAMFYEGHPQSGKGTTISAQKAMLGDKRCAATTITKLGGRFSLQPIMGKLAVFDADAHITRGTDSMASLETIKNLTGNDEVSVDRKGVAEIGNVRMHARFTFAFNEMPTFPDSGASFRRRMLIVRFPNNYENRGDDTIKDRVRAEAPGIARWALDGAADIVRTRTFTESLTSIDAREDFVRNSTPILCFVDECCELSPHAVTSTDDLHAAFNLWAQDSGSLTMKKQWVMRKLYSAVREIKVIRGGRVNSCGGIELNSAMKLRLM